MPCMGSRRKPRSCPGASTTPAPVRRTVPYVRQPATCEFEQPRACTDFDQHRVGLRRHVRHDLLGVLWSHGRNRGADINRRAEGHDRNDPARQAALYRELSAIPQQRLSTRLKELEPRSMKRIALGQKRGPTRSPPVRRVQPALFVDRELGGGKPRFPPHLLDLGVDLGELAVHEAR